MANMKRELWQSRFGYPYIEEAVHGDDGNQPVQRIVEPPKIRTDSDPYIEEQVHDDSPESTTKQAVKKEKPPRPIASYGLLSGLIALARLPDAIFGTNGVRTKLKDLSTANRTNDSNSAKRLTIELNDYLGEGRIRAVSSFIHQKPGK